MFPLICVWINGWENNRETGDMRRCCAHYDVTAMSFPYIMVIIPGAGIVIVKIKNREKVSSLLAILALTASLLLKRHQCDIKGSKRLVPSVALSHCLNCSRLFNKHYDDVIMGAIASQITSLTIVYLTVYSGADQIKHQSSASLAFVWGIHREPVNSPHKWPVTRKMFPFDYVIMKNPVVITDINLMNV